MRRTCESQLSRVKPPPASRRDPAGRTDGRSSASGRKQAYSKGEHVEHEAAGIEATSVGRQVRRIWEVRCAERVSRS